MIVDRRSGDWEAVRAVFSRVVSLFPARIRHLYLLSHCVDKVRKHLEFLTPSFLVSKLTQPPKLTKHVICHM